MSTPDRSAAESWAPACPLLSVTDVEVLHLEPGQVLVAKVPRAVTVEAVSAIREGFARALPGVPVFVVADIDLAVVDAEEVHR